MKNKFFGFFSKFVVVVAGCLMFASFSPSLDGRAVVVDEGVFPAGLFAKTVGYLPGDTISVTNISSNQTVDILVIGALDASEGVAIMLSPEAAKELGIEPASNCIVKITKRSGIDDRVYGTAVIATQNVELSDEDLESVTPEDETLAENVADESYDEEFSVDAEENPAEETFVEEEFVEEPEESLEEEFEDDYVAPEEYETIPAAEEVVEEEDYEEPEEVEEEIESEEFNPEDEFYTEETEPTPEDTAEDEVDYDAISEEEYVEETPEEEVPVEEGDEIEEEEFVADEEEEFVEPEVTDEEYVELPEEYAAIEPEEEYEEDDFLGEELPVEEYVEEETEPELEEEVEAYIPDDEFYMEESTPMTSVIAEPVPVEEPAVEEEIVVEEIVEDEPALETYEEVTFEETSSDDEYEPIVLIPVDTKVAESYIKPAEEEKTEVAPVELTPVEVPSPKADVAPAKETSYEDYLVESLSDLDSSKYYIQIAALSKDSNIIELINKYGKHYPITVVPKAGTSIKYIFVGPVNVDEYKVVLERFKSYGFKDAFIKKLK